MADIPEYRQQVENRPGPQEYQSVRSNPNAFGANVGQAVAGLGNSLYRAGEVFAAIEQMRDDADAREAFNRYREAQNHALLDPESGYLNQTGRHAIGVRETFGQRLDTMREEYGRDLSERARKAYNLMVADTREQANVRMMQHDAQQTRSYIENEHKSTVEGYIEQAAQNWFDEELFAVNLDHALAEQDRLGTLQGWDAETRQRVREGIVSSAFKQRIVQAAVADPLAAQALLDENRGLLSAKDQYDLDTNLRGLVLDRQASDFVQQFVVAGGVDPETFDPMTSDYDLQYDQMLRMAESGDRDDAAATTSSAVGSRQYTSKTYLDAVSQMRTRGQAEWADGMTSEEILATRTDERYAKQVHDYVRKANQQALQQAGFPITIGNEYVMHHFGMGDGVKLLRAQQDNPGATLGQVLGQGRANSIVQANPQFRGKTAGEVVNWTFNHIGADSATVAGQPHFDTGAAIRGALSIEDVDLRDAVLKRIRTTSSAQDMAKDLIQREAQEAAWQRYQQTGQMDLSREERIALGQTGTSAFQAAVQNDLNGIDYTDPETWEELRALMEDPQAFASVNLETRRHLLSKSDMRYFYDAQQQVRTKLEEGPAEQQKMLDELDFKKLTGYGDPIYEAYIDDGKGLDRMGDEKRRERRQQRVSFDRQLTDMVRDFAAREGRAPNESEVRNMAMVLAMPVKIGEDGRFFSAPRGFLFEMAERQDSEDYSLDVDYDAIPYADRNRLNEHLVRSGIEPTRDAVTRRYEQEQLMMAGLPPKIQWEDVPEDFAEEARRRYPNYTRTQIMEAYMAYLMDEFHGED